jgi:hypothetical protein
VTHRARAGWIAVWAVVAAVFAATALVAFLAS